MKTPARISIAAFTFHAHIGAGTMNVFAYLESCRYRYHLGSADIWNGLLGSDPNFYLQKEFLRKVKDAMDERGLALANYHADGCHIWEDDPSVREKHYRLAIQHLQAAEFLGARTVRIDSGGRERHWTSEAFDEIVKRYREFARRGADHGYRVGPETHFGAELYADNMEKLARAVDSQSYGILLHVGRDAENRPEEFDQRLAPYTMHTHVDVKTAETRLEPAITTLLNAGYAGYWGIEAGGGRNEYEEADFLISAVRRALARIVSARPQVQ